MTHDPDTRPLASALSEYDVVAMLGATATQIATSRRLAAAARDLITTLAEQARRDKGTWTVLGVWDNGEAVAVGAIAGDHQVGGDSPGERGNPQYGYDTSSFYEQGVWATWVTAPDADTAQERAEAEMMSDRDSEDDDRTGDDEECEAGTCSGPAARESRS
jgi:hypothetical protein